MGEIRPELECRSCRRGQSMPVVYIAHAPRTDGLPPLEWPVCRAHAQMAMVAGWFPLDPPPKHEGEEG